MTHGEKMDEFADLEADLDEAGSQVSMEFVKSLVMSIEYEGVEPTMFIHEDRESWWPAKRFGWLFLGILLTPFLGFGLLLIYVAFTNGPFFEESDVAFCTVYLADKSIVVSYRMVDSKADRIKCVPISSKSRIHYSEQDVGDNNGAWVGNFQLITDDQKLELIPSVNSSNKRKEGREVVSKFAKLANIVFR